MVRERKGNLRSILHGVLGNAVYQLLTGGFVLGALTALITWLHRLPPALRGGLYGAATVLVVIGVSIGAKRLARGRHTPSEKLSESRGELSALLRGDD